MHALFLDSGLPEPSATTIVVGVYIDMTIGRAIQIPEDVRHRAREMKDQEMAAFV
jgi:hypothetical protein